MKSGTGSVDAEFLFAQSALSCISCISVFCCSLLDPRTLKKGRLTLKGIVRWTPSFCGLIPRRQYCWISCGLHERSYDGKIRKLHVFNSWWNNSTYWFNWKSHQIDSITHVKGEWVPIGKHQRNTWVLNGVGRVPMCPVSSCNGWLIGKTHHNKGDGGLLHFCFGEHW